MSYLDLCRGPAMPATHPDARGDLLGVVDAAVLFLARDSGGVLMPGRTVPWPVVDCPRCGTPAAREVKGVGRVVYHHLTRIKRHSGGGVYVCHVLSCSCWT